MNLSAFQDLASAEAMTQHYSASHLAARQENAQNLARALGMVASPFAVRQNKEESQLALDLLPYKIEEKEWQKLEAGLIQITRTLQAFLQDIYSQDKIFKQPGFPFESILSHPGYQRECRAFSLPDRLHLRFIAIDLIKTVQNQWHVSALHLTSPSGIAYALQNRRIQSQVFPELMESAHVLPISHFPTQLLENLQNTSSASQNRIALLSDASTRHLEFEHGFLARKMGIVLAKSQDLIVRDKTLHYKTVSGLQPIHTLLHFSTQPSFDPILSGKPNGIPGLFHSWRSGRTQLINPPGNAVAESQTLFPWLTRMTRFYLNEEHSLEPLSDATASSTLPCLNPNGTLTHKPFSLRCFILIDKNNICVVPGGLTRVGKEKNLLLNRSYLAKDTWVISSEPSSSPRTLLSDSSLAPQELGSRTAESLYWMGRYCERAECTARMFTVLDEVRLESIRAHNPIWEPLWNALRSSSGYDKEFFKNILKQNSLKTAFYITFDLENAASLFNSVRQARQNANALQDYISPEAGTVINRLEQSLAADAKQSLAFETSAMIPIRRSLETALNQLAAFRGMVLRTMLQDIGNGFFYVGLYIERILMTTASLQAVYQSDFNSAKLAQEEHDIENPIFNAFLRMMGIQDAYHRKYQRRAQSLRVAEILLKEKQSPASLIFCAQRLSDFFTRQIPNFETGNKIATQFIQQLNSFDSTTQKNLTPFLTHISDQTRHLHELILDTFFQHQTPGETQTFIASPFA